MIICDCFLLQHIFASVRHVIYYPHCNARYYIPVLWGVKRKEEKSLNLSERKCLQASILSLSLSGGMIVALQMSPNNRPDRPSAICNGFHLFSTDFFSSARDHSYPNYGRFIIFILLCDAPRSIFSVLPSKIAGAKFAR